MDYDKLAQESGGKVQSDSTADSAVDYEKEAASFGGKARTYRGAPSDPVVQERAKSFAEKAGSYLFDVPTAKDFDFSQVGTSTGIGAAGMMAAPKIVSGIGKVASMIPTVPTRVVGKSLDVLGTALGKMPMLSRGVTGGAAGAVGETTEQVGEQMGLPKVVTLPASFITSGGAGYAANKVMRSLGLEGKEIAKGLKEKGVEISTKMLMDAGLTEIEANAELKRLQGIERQLAGRQTVAGERAAARQATPMATERQRVVERIGAERAKAMDAAKAAGLNEQQTAALVAESEQNVVKAQQAVDALEQQMLSLPGMDKEAFGKQLQATTQKLYTDAAKIRKDAANLNQIEKNAGDALSVSTESIESQINGLLEKTGNPTTRSVLLSIKNELKTKPSGPVISETGEVLENAVSALSLSRASSLKGYMDSIINSKQFGDLKLDKEILNVVRDVKRNLVGSIGEAHPEWLEGLAKFRTLSRPLDIVERNGALAKVLDIDPLSTEFKMAEAEVVGNIISKAKAGNKVFQRLIEKNPDIRESAKLYFTKELFGKESVPTEAGLRTFLKNNESVLKQIGIFDDFKNLRVARTTAQDAVNVAKGEEKIAKSLLTEAGQTRKEAESQITAKSSLQRKAAKRLEETLKTAEPIEDALKRSAARAKPVETEIRQAIGATEKTIEQQKGIQNEFLSLLNNLQGPQALSAKEIPKALESVAERLAQSGYISRQEADAIVNEARQGISEFKSADAAYKRVKQIGAALGLGGLLASGAKVLRSFDSIPSR
jgi:hypothetical protein